MDGTTTLATLAPLALATCRVMGVAAFAPVVAAAAVPVRIRLAIAAVIAVAALPAIGASGLPAAAIAEPWRLLPAAALEFALGAVIGVIAMLPVAAFRTAGSLAGMQAGLGFGQLYDVGRAKKMAATRSSNSLRCSAPRALYGRVVLMHWHSPRFGALITLHLARGAPTQALLEQ